MADPNRAISIHLGKELKPKWDSYCKNLGIKPGAAIKQAIEQQLTKATPKDEPITYAQVNESPDSEKKVRFEIWLTPSEKAAIQKQAATEECSMSRWIIDAIRAGLTHEPQFSTSEIKELGNSNYQLLTLGRNLNQLARRLNEGRYEPVTVEAITRLKQLIDNHTDKVSAAIRASLERWNIQ